jgi:hypothetical protein
MTLSSWDGTDEIKDEFETILLSSNDANIPDD